MLTSKTFPSGPVPTSHLDAFAPGARHQSRSAGLVPLSSASTGPAISRPSERAAKPFRFRLGTSRKKSSSARFDSDSANVLVASSDETRREARKTPRRKKEDMRG